MRVSRRQLRGRRLRTDEELEFGDKRHHERAVRAERCGERRAPGRQFGFTLAQQRPDQLQKGLRHAGIGDVTLVLVKLAGREQAARRHQRSVQFGHHRGLPNAALARDQDQFRPVARDNAVEGRKQFLDLALSPI